VPASGADRTHRLVFFAVLEGLYEDGVANADVDRILREDPATGHAMHFVYGCPLCTPALDAFRVYRVRPKLSGKEETDTFGAGLAPELSKRLAGEEMKERLDAVHTLIARWVERRLDGMRLTDAERAEIRSRMAEGRKRGMSKLQETDRAGAAGAFTGINRCAVCDAANDACGKR
jgi:hypothetical protein